jgi:hypothetical protein
MDLRKELVQVDEADIGLERSNITQQGQIVLPERRSGSSDNDVARLRDPDDYTEPDTQSSTHHVVNKLRQKKHDAGIKLRKKFHIAKPSDDAEKLDAKSPILANTTEIEQSNSRLDNKAYYGWPDAPPHRHGERESLEPGQPRSRWEYCCQRDTARPGSRPRQRLYGRRPCENGEREVTRYQEPLRAAQATPKHLRSMVARSTCQQGPGSAARYSCAEAKIGFREDERSRGHGHRLEGIWIAC